ncbi:hypothetical protein [Peribacillus simplex]|uniref:hypothetical protein n=1 Tax=Peribacillus simplex TaxID=1478 RepID=UPI0011A03566|nr:hypothetical protein [Peribacillus simplex]
MDKEQYEKLSLEEQSKVPASILMRMAYQQILRERQEKNQEQNIEVGAKNDNEKTIREQMADAYGEEKE